jgi:hypothetical protein
MTFHARSRFDRIALRGALLALGLWAGALVASPEATNGLFSGGTANTGLLGATVVQPPTGAVAVATGEDSIDLTWVVSGTAEVTRYEIYRSDDGGPFVHVAGVAHPGTAFPDGGLVPDTTYTYYLVAVADGWGWSSVPSNQASATTDAPPPPPPP